MARAREVDVWFASYDNPMKPVMLAMRAVILGADPRIGECIKWKSPTFEYRGNLASFNPRSKAHASLMFHTGAQIPGDFRSLEGTGAVARFLKVASLEALDGVRAELEAIVRAWCDTQDSGASAKQKPKNKAPAKKQAAQKKAAKKKAPVKQAATKKAATKKAPGKKAPAKQAAAKKAPAKKASRKQVPAAKKKAAAKRRPQKRP